MTGGTVNTLDVLQGITLKTGTNIQIGRDLNLLTSARTSPVQRLPDPDRPRHRRGPPAPQGNRHGEQCAHAQLNLVEQPSPAICRRRFPPTFRAT